MWARTTPASWRARGRISPAELWVVFPTRSVCTVRPLAGLLGDSSFSSRTQGLPPPPTPPPRHPVKFPVVNSHFILTAPTCFCLRRRPRFPALSDADICDSACSFLPRCLSSKVRGDTHICHLPGAWPALCMLCVCCSERASSGLPRAASLAALQF